MILNNVDQKVIEFQDSARILRELKLYQFLNNLFN